jgi:hypothetical protein
MEFGKKEVESCKSWLELIVHNRSEGGAEKHSNRTVSLQCLLIDHLIPFPDNLESYNNVSLNLVAISEYHHIIMFIKRVDPAWMLL